MSYANYAKEWSDRINKALSAEGQSRDRASQEARAKALLKALPGYLLFCFCEEQKQDRATRWEPLEGIRPAQLYVIQKHHWLPDQAFSLTHEQLQLVLHDELRELALPERAIEPVQADLDAWEMEGVHLNGHHVPD